MREATKEEREGIEAYIESISIPTGINLLDFWQSQLPEKGSVNLSKEEKYKFIFNLIKNDEGCSEVELERIGFTDFDEVLKEIVLKGLEVLLDDKLSTI